MADLVHPTSGAVTDITPAGGWHGLGLMEIWHHRELLRVLTMRDVRVRYKQTLLGLCWAVIQPVAAMVVFTVVLYGAAGVPSQAGVPYPIFTYSGLVLWLYFAEALNRASRSLITNHVLVSKIYFPRLVAPLSGVIAPLFDLVIAFVVLLGMMAWYGTGFSLTLLLAPVFVVGAAWCAAAFGILLSALNVEYRDIGYAVPLAVQMWLFLTPVVYPAEAATGVLKGVLAVNPMAGIIGGFRWAVLGQGEVDIVMLVPAAVVLAAVSVIGTAYFRRVERTFADVI